jgi:hypothetical protein
VIDKKMAKSGIQEPEFKIQNEIEGSHSEISSKTRQQKTISTMQVFLSQGDGQIETGWKKKTTDNRLQTTDFRFQKNGLKSCMSPRLGG